MNKKIDKYYDYIVDDLINKTKKDFALNLIILSLKNKNLFFKGVIPHNFHILGWISQDKIINFLVETYGIKEDEVNKIWSRYSARFNNFIKQQRDT